MSNGPEIANLNRLINEIKILSGSISILVKASSEKDQTLESTALDAINFRVREISKLTINLTAANLKPTNFSIDSILLELDKAKPSSKLLRDSLEPQLESLRKWALSETLTLSIQ